MAKAVEDTAFYRYNRLIALNEVGGEPDHFGASATEFHAEMTRRLLHTPAALSATSTHDTKRGEDARARLYVLSEMPDAWRKAVNRWSHLTAANRSDCGGVTTPEPEVEWMFYQALLGAWPAALRPDDNAGLADLSGRMIEFMLKAVREAKVHTSWTGQNEVYENAVRLFTVATLDPSRSRVFLEDFALVCEPIFVTGALNSLVQTAIKLTAPGVSDIFQGSELWDLSLVDPDNRRSVDFDAREAALRTVSTTPAKDVVSGWRGGAIKMHLIQAGLRLRSSARAVFERGDYLPLMAEGRMADHALGFARVTDGNAVVVIVPRHSLEIMRDHTDPLVPHRRWHDTKVQLPERLSNRRFYNVVTGEIAQGGSLALRQVLLHFPVGILSTQPVTLS
jgi:(1->4)-alpha-D-glucan 1-alpha-D-glucosylmutase